MGGAIACAAPARAGTRRLRYGGDAAFAPFESLDTDGRPRGFQIELLAALGEVAGVEFDIALAPWSRTESEFRAGRLDVVAMVDIPARHGWALFARGHATPLMAVYLPAGRPQPQALHDLSDLRIAIVDTEVMRDTLTEWLKGVPGPFIRVPDAARALSAVREGAADAALLLRAYGDPEMRAEAGIGLVAAHLAMPLQAYALAVPPGQEALLAQLQRGLDTLEADGRLDALRVRWLSSHRDIAERGSLARRVEQQRDWTWGLAGASAVALAGLGIGLWRRGRRMRQERARREAAEAELHRTRELLERTFDRNPDGMLVVEQGSRIVRDANASVATLIGAPVDTVIGRALEALDSHLDEGALGQLVSMLAAEGTLDAVPLRVRRADGDLRHCLVTADRFAIDGEPHVFTLLRDITAQLAADAALRRAYEDAVDALARERRETEAARASRAQAEESLQAFTRAVAHDLRTPVNAVHGLAGMLRRRLEAGRLEDALACADRIERAALRMNSMIHALSRLSRIGRDPLARGPVDMRAMVEDTVALIATAHPERATEFRVEALPMAQADADLTQQVWQNLLDNAAKYSAKAARPVVKVDSHADARGTWYRVTDNGAGFDMAQAGTLFQPFQRMHAASDFEGTGVGLSVVRRIVDHHRGEVRLRSAPGVGTVAEFTLDPAPPA